MIQQRSIVTCVVLYFLTCGLYGIYWFIKLTDEANSISKQNQTASGGMAFLFNIITCSIYGYYWMYKQGEKIDEAKNEMGIMSNSTGIIYLILYLFGFGIVSYGLMQNEMNKLA